MWRPVLLMVAVMAATVVANPLSRQVGYSEDIQVTIQDNTQDVQDLPQDVVEETTVLAPVASEAAIQQTPIEAVEAVGDATAAPTDEGANDADIEATVVEDEVVSDNLTDTQSQPQPSETVDTAASNADVVQVAVPEAPAEANESAPAEANESETLAPAEANESETVAAAEANESVTLAPAEANESETLAPAEANESVTLAPAEANESETLPPAEANVEDTEAPAEETIQDVKSPSNNTAGLVKVSVNGAAFHELPSVQQVPSDNEKGEGNPDNDYWLKVNQKTSEHETEKGDGSPVDKELEKVAEKYGLRPAAKPGVKASPATSSAAEGAEVEALEAEGDTGYFSRVRRGFASPVSRFLSNLF